MLKAALLVGTQSGCGKTTVMLALLQYLKSKQLTVNAFKVGPDFLDPFWHQAITGNPSYNLDTQMMGSKECIEQFNLHSEEGHISLIEGVMGLFDGKYGVGEKGSSANLASILKIPVILIVDCKGMAGSIVPLVSGYCDYAQKFGFNISGIIANRLGSERHAKIIDELLNNYKLPPLLGWMDKNAPILPERHLGLKRPEESEVPNFLPFFHIENNILSKTFANLNKQIPAKSAANKPDYLLQGKTIAVAKDQACCFIYPENINWLKKEGAEVRFFSPIGGEPVPNADALWLPGGYPELYAEELSISNSWISIRKMIALGKPVFAECGGAMILGAELIDIQGKSWKMSGVFPYISIMESKLIALGYRETSEGMRGHEFHHSRREKDKLLNPCFNTLIGDKGVYHKNVRASYIHWYFSSAPKLMAGWLS